MLFTVGKHNQILVKEKYKEIGFEFLILILNTATH